MAKIYTRTGDKGKAGLFGGGRVSKQHPRLEAYGTLDELNAYLGWAAVRTRDAETVRLLHAIQSRLFDLGAHLATPPGAHKARKVLPPLPQTLVLELETAIDAYERKLPSLHAFVLPGGNEAAAVLQVARAVCRRAERAAVRVAARSRIHASILPYLNRLSDLLFVMARHVVVEAGDEESLWSPERPK